MRHLKRGANHGPDAPRRAPGLLRRWFRDPGRATYYADILIGWILFAVLLDIVIFHVYS